MQPAVRILWCLCICAPVFTSCNQQASTSNTHTAAPAAVKEWSAPDTGSIGRDAAGGLIRYGRNLVVHTAYYLGPKGVVMHTTNGMNCQNCHLDAGTKVYGNNYSAVASTYPKLRARSGKIESIEDRVNDCLVRSLNGTALDSSTKEMQALVAYITWVGHEVPKDSVPKGAGIFTVPLLDRAADAEKGKTVFEQKCTSCHMPDGEGKRDSAGAFYIYPPLWGAHSYNTGAGLFRLSRFAGYVKANMPFGTDYKNPTLTDEDAWDVAAYVNSRPRPDKKFKQDWPDIKLKPYDHPFGPYADTFTELRHKLGPFQELMKR